MRSIRPCLQRRGRGFPGCWAGARGPAAKQAETYLKQNPADVQMRFLQGVIAAEQRQSAQAIKIFTALTREYPNLPEPYNNLAVLYAAEGQERKASEVLEQAIRTNPSYATGAMRTWRSLCPHMAKRLAYGKGILQLDGSRQAIQPKLALITQIFPKQGGATTKVATEHAGRGGGGTAAKTGRKAKKPAAEARAANSRPRSQGVEAMTRQAEAKAAEVETGAGQAAQRSRPRKRPPQEKMAQDRRRAAEPAAKAGSGGRLAAHGGWPQRARQGVPAARKKAGAAFRFAGVERPPSRAWGQPLGRPGHGSLWMPYSDHFLPGRWQQPGQVEGAAPANASIGRASIVVTVGVNLQGLVDGDKATAQFRQYYASAPSNDNPARLALQREKGQCASPMKEPVADA
ncbi:hypothetical protein FQR65_LT20427 [Abscondita terminalis]|nr:hypothetical protein FQR65_LT20427 [Abscondita terminalis]